MWGVLRVGCTRAIRERVCKNELTSYKNDGSSLQELKTGMRGFISAAIIRRCINEDCVKPFYVKVAASMNSLLIDEKEERRQIQASVISIRLRLFQLHGIVYAVERGATNQFACKAGISKILIL